MAATLRRIRSKRVKAAQGTGGRKQSSQTYVWQFKFGARSLQGCCVKTLMPEDKKTIVLTMKEQGVSHRQACKQTGLARSTGSYKPQLKKDDDVIEQLQTLVEKHPAIGFWQSFYRIAKFITKSSLVILLLGVIRRLELKPNSEQKAEHIIVAPQYCQTACWWHVPFLFLPKRLQKLQL